MGHAAGQGPHGLHFLGLGQLPLECFAVGQVLPGLDGADPAALLVLKWGNGAIEPFAVHAQPGNQDLRFENALKWIADMGAVADGRRGIVPFALFGQQGQKRRKIDLRCGRGRFAADRLRRGNTGQVNAFLVPVGDLPLVVDHQGGNRQMLEDLGQFLPVAVQCFGLTRHGAVQ